MHIRCGFVSNSSTTSFSIFGSITSLSEDECDLLAEAKKLGLEVHHGYENTYLGVSWHEIGDDETGRQFMDRVATAVNELDPQADECGHCEEAFRDG